MFAINRRVAVTSAMVATASVVSGLVAGPVGVGVLVIIGGSALLVIYGRYIARDNAMLAAQIDRGEALVRMRAYERTERRAHGSTNTINLTGPMQRLY